MAKLEDQVVELIAKHPHLSKEEAIKIVTEKNERKKKKRTERNERNEAKKNKKAEESDNNNGWKQRS